MIAKLIAGMALFMFGMMFFEETVRTAFGNSIKQSIQKYAGWLRRSILIGWVSTAILQSSMVVIMLMLGFIGAGILNLTQGIGIVLGANIGSTMTPWLIALLGFKLDIEALTLPIIAVGGLLLFAGNRYKKVQVLAKFILGFGLLFLGLGYMKESVDVLSSSFSLANSGIGLFKSIVIGAIMTVVLQTSTGSSMLTLTALSSGIITFDIALGIIIGANFGSAISTFLIWFFWSDKTQVTKRIIAATHLIFNALTMILMLFLLHPVNWVMQYVWLVNDPVIGIAAFHTIYNVIGVWVFAPFVRKYVAYLQKKWWVWKQDDKLFAIQQRITDLPEEYLSWMKIDLKDFAQDVVGLITTMTDKNHADATALIDHYTETKKDLEEWISLVLVYNPEDATKQQLEQLEAYQLVAVEYLNAIKQLKDISLHYYTLQQRPTAFIKNYIDTFSEKLVGLTEVIETLFDGRTSVVLVKKVDVIAQELELDDNRFMKDIRMSIARYNDDRENNHAWSQLIKINRSILLSSEAILKAVSYYGEIATPDRIETLSRIS